MTSAGLTPVETILFAMGSIVVLAGVAQLFVKQALFWKVTVPLVFGVLLLGLGGFGLAFMGPYRDFLNVIKPMLQSPSAETYAKAAEELGSGTLTAANAEVVKALMVNRPIPELQAIVTEQLARAGSPVGKNALLQVEAALTAQTKVAEEIVTRAEQQGAIEAGRVESLEPGTRTRVAQAIERNAALIQRLSPTDRRRIQELSKVEPVKR